MGPGRACPRESGVLFGKLAQSVRVAVTGTTVSPSLFGTLVLIGRERTLARLDGARALAASG